MASNGRAGSIPAPSTSKSSLFRRTLFRSRRVTQSVGGVSGDLSAWSCIVAEAYCFAIVSLVCIVKKVNSISFLSIRPMLATMLPTSAPIVPLWSPLNCGDRSIPSGVLYWGKVLLSGYV